MFNKPWPNKTTTYFIMDLSITALQPPLLQLSPCETSPVFPSEIPFSDVWPGTLRDADLVGFSRTSGVWSKDGLSSLANRGKFCFSAAKSLSWSFKLRSSFLPVIDSGSSGFMLEWGPFWQPERVAFHIIIGPKFDVWWLSLLLTAIQDTQPLIDYFTC